LKKRKREREKIKNLKETPPLSFFLLLFFKKILVPPFSLFLLLNAEY